MEINLKWEDIGTFFPPKEDSFQATPINKELFDKAGIIDSEVIDYIIAHFAAEEYENYLQNKKERLKKYQKRFSIPIGLDKKQLQDLLKETQEILDNLKTIINKTDIEDRIFLEIEQKDYIIKKEKINKILKLHGKFGTEININKAKEYPIDQLIEFKNNVALCIFHSEKTGSMYYDKKRNKIHCFGCQIDADSIDIAQKLFNLSFNEAVKRLNN